MMMMMMMLMTVACNVVAPAGSGFDGALHAD